MNRNTLIIRLLVLGGAAIALAVLVAGLLLPFQQRGEQGEALLLSEAELESRLSEAGHAVAELRREGGVYQVHLEDGSRIWVDGVSGQEIAVPESRGSALQNSQVRRLLRDGGYSEISGLQWRRGAFEAEAEDAEGQRWRLRLDTYSGEILEREAL
ncbi:hypothetical protein [Aquibaculum arenosum]|uniref:PepSY domain-containing protein n=1 Tax=Aquibaculum arenosum TaxID=3032591 RepID=A0ABT5YQI4_9PROT|nr:hypothetical protein [Fodinicurvata sp. CAU 1616]MDF2097154.1 hypothetical protein [Fodinicurvata sp. CAU 1616]